MASFSSPLLLHSPPTLQFNSRRIRSKRSYVVKASSSSSKITILHVSMASVAAASLLICCTGEVAAANAAETGKNCRLTYISSGEMMVSDDSTEINPPTKMGGMSMKNFDPVRYSGRWFEVASLKLGFAGQGQGDCHCTQGLYRYDEAKNAIQVDTICVHGSPDGYITGIRGKVQCVDDSEIMKLKSETERQQMIKQKCYLRFPTIPFIPKLPYDVLATDYDSYALVSGAKDTSFIQIYSRDPNPGSEFIEKYKAYLGERGYNPDEIKDTPQDCEVMSVGEMDAMMAAPEMDQVMNNTFPSLTLAKSIQLNPFTSLFDTLKKLLRVYFS